MLLFFGGLVTVIVGIILLGGSGDITSTMSPRTQTASVGGPCSNSVTVSRTRVRTRDTGQPGGSARCGRGDRPPRRPSRSPARHLRLPTSTSRAAALTARDERLSGFNRIHGVVRMKCSRLPSIKTVSLRPDPPDPQRRPICTPPIPPRRGLHF